MLFVKFLIALCIVLALIPHLLWLLAWAICHCFHYSLPYAPFGWSALGLVAFALLIISYGYYIGRWKLVTTELHYSHPSVPTSFEGMRIAHISDFHLSTFADNPKQLERFVDAINAQHPDLICFTGDLVSLSMDELYPHIQALRRLSAPYGVCSVLGNHDFFLYSRQYPSPEEKEAAVEELARIQRDSLGWHLLRNESYRIAPSAEKTSMADGESENMYILGVDNSNCAKQGFHTIHRGDLRQAMAGTDGFRILLTHDPSHWRGEVLPNTDIPLTLCGHTHAAQIRLLGWTPASWTFREVAGRYDENGVAGVQTMYINIGLGCTIPMRLGANPEITIITLGRESGF